MFKGRHKSVKTWEIPQFGGDRVRTLPRIFSYFTSFKTTAHSANACVTEETSRPLCFIKNNRFWENIDILCLEGALKQNATASCGFVQTRLTQKRRPAVPSLIWTIDKKSSAVSPRSSLIKKILSPRNLKENIRKPQHLSSNSSIFRKLGRWAIQPIRNRLSCFSLSKALGNKWKRGLRIPLQWIESYRGPLFNFRTSKQQPAIQISLPLQ